MLETIAVVLVVLWVLGLVSSVTLGGFIHLLLALAIIVVLVRVIQGRKAPRDRKALLALMETMERLAPMVQPAPLARRVSRASPVFKASLDRRANPAPKGLPVLPEKRATRATPAKTSTWTRHWP